MKVNVPVSVGEVVDKITILRIKNRRISDETKRRNVKSELEALLAICAEVGINANSDLAQELETVNLKLWDIEDAIREKERAQSFDDEFIQLARSVYVTNDERFAIKNRLNQESGSFYREEKSYKKY